MMKKNITLWKKSMLHLWGGSSSHLWWRHIRIYWYTLSLTTEWHNLRMILMKTNRGRKSKSNPGNSSKNAIRKSLIQCIHLVNNTSKNRLSLWWRNLMLFWWMKRAWNFSVIKWISFPKSVSMPTDTWFASWLSSKKPVVKNIEIEWHQWSVNWQITHCIRGSRVVTF